MKKLAENARAEADKIDPFTHEIQQAFEEVRAQASAAAALATSSSELTQTVARDTQEIVDKNAG